VYDRILVVDKGQMVESGMYEELLSLNGVFATLSGGIWTKFGLPCAHLLFDF
jgi:ABC-type transport system involved in Fe-S cluster assembly fused permease/ATPase subunit